MKSISQFISWFFLAILCVSCNEKDPVESKTTFYPVVNNVLLEVGDSFSFSDIKIFEGEKQIEFDDLDTTVNIDTSKLGAYGIEYSATNVDGFTRSGTVFVAVVEDKEVVLQQDLSGVYVDDGFPEEGDVKVESLGNGFFKFSDLDVLVSDKVAAVIAVLDKDRFALPEQGSALGTIIPSDLGSYDDTSLSLEFSYEDFPDWGLIPLLFTKKSNDK